MVDQVTQLLSALRRNPTADPSTLPGAPGVSAPSTNAPMQDIYATMAARPTDMEMAITQRNLARAQDRGGRYDVPATRSTARGWTVATSPFEHLGATMKALGGQRNARRLEKTLQEQAQNRQQSDAAVARYQQAREDYRWAMEFGQEADKIAAEQALAKAKMDYTEAWNQVTRQDSLARQQAQETRNLADDIAPVTATMSAMRALDDKLAPYMEGGELYNENVPGVGLLEGDPGWVGSVARLVQDLRTPGSPNADMYASVRGMLNQFIKQDAGLQQTIHEMRNQLTAQGLEGLTDEEVFLSTYPDVRKRVEQRLNAIRGGYRDSVVEAYEQRFPDVFAPFEDFSTINKRRLGSEYGNRAITQWTSQDEQSALQGQPQINPQTGEPWVYDSSSGQWVPQSQTGQIQR